MLCWLALAVLLAIIAIQLVPYGKDHANPTVRAEPVWDSPRTRQLAARACFNCHSNETAWPWYSNVAPISWMVQRDVEEGREALNFSEWDRAQEEAGEAAEVVQEGEMPPRLYTLFRPTARLSTAETQALIDGLIASLGQVHNRGERRRGGERD
ncbi:MAG: heme-binding domain-containing protein [Chloroflexi bacterium]|nr:heme-binding domain-containing protein [Chloroflexota bacterium]